MVNLMCRDELIRDGVALESLADWHRLHDHGASRKEAPPMKLLPYRSGHTSRAPRLSCTHKQIERASSHARGADGKTCGDEGWLQVEKLDDWFGKYGRPIAINSDVQRYASLVLRRPPNPDSMLQKKGGIPPLPRWAPYPDLGADLRVKRMHDAIPVRRFNATFAGKLERAGIKPGASETSLSRTYHAEHNQRSVSRRSVASFRGSASLPPGAAGRAAYEQGAGS